MTTYTRIPTESITDAELDALENGAWPCGTTRPETLGHQRCYRIKGHGGGHKSQDDWSWING